MLELEGSISYEYDEELENYYKNNDNLFITSKLDPSAIKGTSQKFDYIKGAESKLNNRNGNAIKNSIIKLIKMEKNKEITHLTKAAVHFTNSIHGTHSNEIFYESIENDVKWYL